MGFARPLTSSMNSMGWTGRRRKGQDTMPKEEEREWLK
jgi:hypothetical protein